MDNPDRQRILQGMTQTSDILIVGGGLAGPSLALALAQKGLTVTIIDALPATTRAESGFDGRSYALSLASQRLLGALGLWRDLADTAQPMLEIKVSDGRAGEGPSP
ncbi:MAG: FAD-dependent oxidoreductase, partial [Donghicola eburneus]